MSTETIDERGNKVFREHNPGDRYEYDFYVCTAARGWQQYDTKQDAWYFGVWVNRGTRTVFSYAEGDCAAVVCPTDEAFTAELARMAEFYGPPPPAFVGIDTKTGEVTHYIDARPE